MITIRTLGPFEVHAGDVGMGVDVKGNKNRALLVYLARSPRRSRSREHLTGLLWADKPDEKARHSLREAVRVLRQQLGSDMFEGGADRIGIDGGRLTLDADEFEGLVAAKKWQSASSLVAGEFLEGLSIKGAWAFEEWLTAERTFWRGRSVLALTSWCDELLAEGRTAEAVETAIRAQALDPVSETAIRACLRSLALSGDRAAALAQYDQHLERIAKFGAEPDVETKQLADQVGNERSWNLQPPVAKGAAKGAESRRTPLIGRQKELSALVDCWERCQAEGQSTVCLIEGDSGSGKTRLTEELVARARLSSAAVATFRAVPGDRDASRAGITNLGRGGLLDAKGLAAASSTALGAFAAEIPEWADSFGIPKSTPQPLEAALIDVVRVAAIEQPVLLYIDDAQWCDRTTLHALISVVRDLAHSPVLVMFSYLDEPPREELDDLRSRISRDLSGVFIQLEALAEPALRELTAWAMPEYQDEQVDRLTRRIANDSAGLPLLAVELLHAVALGMDLGKTTSAWPQPLRTLSQTLPSNLPDTIIGAIRVGFRRLTKEAQLLLSAAAVLDNPVTPEDLARGTGLTGEKLDGALDELEWQRWLAADARGYSFVARIVREVVSRDMVTEGQRQRIFRAKSLPPSGVQRIPRRA